MTIEEYASSQVASAVGSTTKSGNSKDMGKEQFLMLLVEQMKNQDPLNPMDSTQFTAQLAQFSTLEQLLKANETLTSIKTIQDNQTKGNPIDYIGRVIKADDDTMAVEKGEVIPAIFSLTSNADVKIAVYDKSGNEVRRLDAGTLTVGEHSIDWDGRNNAGDIVQDGDYTFEIFAKDESGDYMNVDTYTSGLVSGVTNKYGTPYLMVGDRLIAVSNVIEVTTDETKN